LLLCHGSKMQCREAGAATAPLRATARRGRCSPRTSLPGCFWLLTLAERYARIQRERAWELSLTRRASGPGQHWKLTGAFVVGSRAAVIDSQRFYVLIAAVSDGHSRCRRLQSWALTLPRPETSPWLGLLLLACRYSGTVPNHRATPKSTT
jgi:hypothetical protein